MYMYTNDCIYELIWIKYITPSQNVSANFKIKKNGSITEL